MYSNHPEFDKYRKRSELNFKSYEVFDENAISERTELYRSILKDHWKKTDNRNNQKSTGSIVIDEEIETEN